MDCFRHYICECREDFWKEKDSRHFCAFSNQLQRGMIAVDSYPDKS